MVPLSECFMLDDECIINEELVKMIHHEGYTRIPVYRRKRENIIGVLHLTDIIFINPYVKIQISSVIDFYQRSVLKIDSDAKLGVVLKSFISGVSHLAIIYDRQDDESQETTAIGLITLTDVLHEILGIKTIEKNVGVKHSPDMNMKKSSYLVSKRKTRGKLPKTVSITTQLSTTIANFLKNGNLFFLI